MSNEETIILGIDPGFSFTGYAVIKKTRVTTLLLDCGYVRFSPRNHLAQRVREFYDLFGNKVVQHHVTGISLETSFLGKNAQTFLKLGYLRGVLYLLASQHQLSIQEFAPREVKQLLTGFGGADKEQIAKMIFTFFPHLRNLKAVVRSDVTDAVAIALAGTWHIGRQSREQSLRI